MRILVAPDTFRGTCDAIHVAQIIKEEFEIAGHVVDSCPLGDGGEGTLQTLVTPNRQNIVTGPLGNPVEAEWYLANHVAVIEVAQIIGILLAGGSEENDPVNATSNGVGELLHQAVLGGAKEITVCVGGTASTDGGWGMLQTAAPHAIFQGVSIQVACDVDTFFVDAAKCFAPQKGATPTQVKFLENRLHLLEQMYRDDYGCDLSNLRFAGAGGGLAGGLHVLGATLVSGFSLVSDHVGLGARMEQADLVITGEGFLDAESYNGKVVGGVVSLANELEVPVSIICGDYDESISIENDRVYSLVETFGEQNAYQNTETCLRGVARKILDSVS